MIRYDKEVEIFEFLPAKLKTRRSAFGALLAYVTDKCWNLTDINWNKNEVLVEKSEKWKISAEI